MNAASSGGGFNLRPASMDDLDGITQMLDATTRYYTGRRQTREQAQERMQEPHMTIELDTVIAVDDETGQIIGFGSVWPSPPGEAKSFARTHPDHRGRGVGTALQRRLIARAEQLATQSATSLGGLLGKSPTGEYAITVTTWEGDSQAPGVLQALGYTPARYYMEMVRSLDGVADDAVPTPDGLSVRGHAEEDDDAVYAAFAEAFADHFGADHVDRAEFFRDHRDGPASNYQPDLWLVAVDGDEVAGFCIGTVQQDGEGVDHGYIAELGVRPGWRGRRLGESLLTQVFVKLGERGLPYVKLHVDADNTTGATRLYTKVGMTTKPSFTIWSRALSTG